jgi:uncharacterized protein YggE
MRLSLASLCLLLLPTVAAAQINTLPSAPHLLVKGHADARVVPDRFTVRLNVNVTDMSPNVARQKVEAHMQQLFEALDAAGALKGYTHASSLSIQPQTDYEDGKSVFKGTQVSRSIDATFDRLDKLRLFIAAVPADEEVQLGGVQTARSDIDEISSRLRAAAVENSKVAAEKIAADYGMKIVGVYAVSEVAPDFAYGVQAGSWGGPQTLQAITVTGSRVLGAPPPPPGVAMRIGTMSVEQDIYAVYLTAPK